MLPRGFSFKYGLYGLFPGIIVVQEIKTLAMTKESAFCLIKMFLISLYQGLMYFSFVNN